MSLADAFAARLHHTLTTPYSLAECRQRIGPDTPVRGPVPSDPRPFVVAWQGPDCVRLRLSGLRARQMRRQLRVSFVPSDHGTALDATTQIDPVQNILVVGIGVPLLFLFGALLTAVVARGATTAQLFPLPFLCFVPVLVYTLGRVRTARQVDALLRNLEFVLGARVFTDTVTPLVARRPLRAVARQPLVPVPETVRSVPTFTERLREQRRFSLSSPLPPDECRRRIEASGLFDVRAQTSGDMLLMKNGSSRAGAYEIRVHFTREGAQTVVDAVGRQRGALLGIVFPWAPLLAVLLALGAPHGIHGLVVISPFAAVPIGGMLVAGALTRFLPGSQHNFLPAALADLLDAHAVAA